MKIVILKTLPEITFSSSDVSDGSENGKIEFKTKAAGSTQELLTLESNKAILGGFLTPRLDLIFGAYAPANDNSTTAGTRSVDYYGFIQTIGALEGVVCVPYAAEDASEIVIDGETDPTESYAINQPWGQSSKKYIEKFTMNNNNTQNYSLSSNPAVDSGYNFYHISGTPTVNGNININLPSTPIAGAILVFVIKAKLIADGQNDLNLNFVAGQALDRNSVAIIANAPVIARAYDIENDNSNSVHTTLKIIKDYTSNTAVKTRSRISGYVYCNPIGTSHYQILAAIYAARPGDSNEHQSIALADEDHDSVRVVFS